MKNIFNNQFGILIKLIAITICTLLIIFNNFDLEFLSDLKTEIKFTILTLAATIILDIIILIKDNYKFAWIILQSLNVLKFKNKLRISMAYLIQINIGDEYLLVFNEKRNQYQPVGGVYKYNSSIMRDYFQRITIHRDTISDVENGENDLRLFLQNRLHLNKFISWFLSDQNRESDPWREFHEELISTGILKSENFTYIDYTKKWQIFDPIVFDTNLKRNIDTFRYVDVYELNVKNQLNQEKELTELKNKHDPLWLWATYIDIKKGFKEVNGKKLFIADISWKILEEKKVE